MKRHLYKIQMNWTGNLGVGTKNFRSYSRNHEIVAPGKAVIDGSSDPSFRGDPGRYNPEELFLSALSSCHMLWFLHLCSIRGISVLQYEDHAEGVMIEEANGSGRFAEVHLYPRIQLREAHSDEVLRTIHQEANKKCFIAQSCNFPVRHTATYQALN